MLSGSFVLPMITRLQRTSAQHCISGARGNKVNITRLLFLDTRVRSKHINKYMCIYMHKHMRDIPSEASRKLIVNLSYMLGSMCGLIVLSRTILWVQPPTYELATFPFLAFSFLGWDTMLQYIAHLVRHIWICSPIQFESNTEGFKFKSSSMGTRQCGSGAHRVRLIRGM